MHVQSLRSNKLASSLTRLVSMLHFARGSSSLSDQFLCDGATPAPAGADAPTGASPWEMNFDVRMALAAAITNLGTLDDDEVSPLTLIHASIHLS